MIKPFKPNRIFHSYRLCKFISALRVVWWFVSFCKFYIADTETLIRRSDATFYCILSGSALFAFVPKKDAMHL